MGSVPLGFKPIFFFGFFNLLRYGNQRSCLACQRLLPDPHGSNSEAPDQKKGGLPDGRNKKGQGYVSLTSEKAFLSCQ
jgi:hypothetical protein